MNTFILLSVVLAFSLYFPLCVQILKGKSEQNFTTWILWAILDGVSAFTIFVKDGNSALAWAYASGSLIAALCIFKSGNFSWTWFETFITILVLVCLVVWYLYGAQFGKIAGSVSMVVAGLPQLFECFKKPEKTLSLFGLGILLQIYCLLLEEKIGLLKKDFTRQPLQFIV